MARLDLKPGCRVALAEVGAQFRPPLGLPGSLMEVYEGPKGLAAHYWMTWFNVNPLSSESLQGIGSDGSQTAGKSIEEEHNV